MRTHILSLLCVVLGACNSSQAPPLDTKMCVQGWWVDPSAVTCSACTGSKQNPECTQDDCQQLSFEGFVSDTAAFDGILTYSKKAGTISSVGPGVWREYTIAGSQIQLSGSRGGSLTCSGQKLEGSYSYQVRASSGISTALSTGTANKATSFRSVPTGP